MINNVGKNNFHCFLVKCPIFNVGNESIQWLPVQIMIKTAGGVFGHSFHAT